MCPMCYFYKNQNVQNKRQYYLGIYIAIIIAYINFKMYLEIIKAQMQDRAYGEAEMGK